MAFDLAAQLSQLLDEPEPQKAAIHCLDRAAWSIPEVQFNPSTLALARQAGWAVGNEALAPWSSLSYTRGQPDTLSFTLLFDQTHYEPEGAAATIAQSIGGATGAAASLDAAGSNDASVTDQVAALYRLTLPIQAKTGNAGGRMRPPVVYFLWGDLQFTGVLESVNVEFLLFGVDGRPRRATAQCAMRGRALQLSASPAAFFGVEYAPPTGAAVWKDPVTNPLDDPRVHLLARLRR